MVPETERENHIRIEMAHRKLSAKPTLYEKIAREFTPGEIKHIRRREYYNRRVRPDFAPPKIDQEIPDIIRRLDNMDDPLTPDTRDREEKRLNYLVSLREKTIKFKENLPEFKHQVGMNPNMEQVPLNKKYIKQSEKLQQLGLSKTPGSKDVSLPPLSNNPEVRRNAFQQRNVDSR